MNINKLKSKICDAQSMLVLFLIFLKNPKKIL